MLDRISKKLGDKSIIDKLSEQLSGSDFNTLLMEVFHRRSNRIPPKQLLNLFNTSRFFSPSIVDPVQYKELEIEWLKYAKAEGFQPTIFSPAAPLGICSSIAHMHQNNVISAGRNCEIVSDITNVMALHTASLLKKEPNTGNINLATTHRLMRTQTLASAEHTAHFGLICLTTGGLDTGSYAFEVRQLEKHLCYHSEMIGNYADSYKVETRILLSEEKLRKPVNQLIEKLKGFSIVLLEEPLSGDYYYPLRFQTYLITEDSEINLADGGVVDWTQKLLSNKKQRFFISACGLELVYKLLLSES